MPPIGETLREARMRQKLDIADVEERTKIRAKYLRALENEEWGLLPGPTFVKTFLRTYAEVVGVDPHLLVEEYRSQHEAARTAELQPVAAARARAPAEAATRGPAAGPPGPPSRLAVVAGLVVAVVAFLLVLGLLSGDEDGGRPTSAPAAETTAGHRARAARRAEAQAAGRPRPRGSRCGSRPTVPTYACLDTGDGHRAVFEGTLERRAHSATPRELRLNLGKRSVELRVNGKAVEIPHEPRAAGPRRSRRRHEGDHRGREALRR